MLPLLYANLYAKLISPFMLLLMRYFFAIALFILQYRYNIYIHAFRLRIIHTLTFYTFSLSLHSFFCQISPNNNFYLTTNFHITVNQQFEFLITYSTYYFIIFCLGSIFLNLRDYRYLFPHYYHQD